MCFNPIPTMQESSRASITFNGQKWKLLCGLSYDTAPLDCSSVIKVPWQSCCPARPYHQACINVMFDYFYTITLRMQPTKVLDLKNPKWVWIHCNRLWTEEAKTFISKYNSSYIHPNVDPFPCFYLSIFYQFSPLLYYTDNFSNG